MALDILGNSFGGYDIENDTDAELMRRRREEERRRQLAAQGQTTPVKQTVTIDPVTGEQKMKIEGSVQDLSAANPLTPTVVAPSKPVSPADLYNQYTQQQESGSNPNIGYHNPQKSTAYGAYGLTAPQYQEMQRANPQFAGRDITTLTPQEQAQANLTSRDVYAQQLRAKGVEPTEENIRLAHFLGAGGANQFLKSGAISPEAAAANGGEDKVRQIALARLNGPVAPIAPGQQQPMIAGTPTSDVGLTPTEQAVSQLRQQGQVPPVAPAAPVNPNAPQPTLAQMAPGAPEQAGPPTNLMTQQGWAERLNTARQDDKMLASLAYDPNTPQFVREEASNDLYNRLATTKNEKKALQEWQAAVKNGDLVPVMNKMKKDNEEGSWLKYLFYGFIDPNMAKNERLKLFPDEGAKWVDFTNADGTKHGLIQMGKNGLPLKGKFDDGTSLNEQQLMEYSQGVSSLAKGIHTGMTLYNMSDNKTATLGNDGRFYRNGRALPASVTATSEFKEGVNQRKQIFNEAVKQIGKWYEVDPSQITPQAMQNLVTQLTPPGGNRADTIQMLQEDARNKGANPQVIQKIDSVSSMITPTAGSTIAGTKSGLAVSESTGKKLGESNIEYSNTLAKDRQTATSQRSTIDRLQKSIDTNPEFWGVVSSSPAFMAFRDAQSDEKKSAALNQLAINLNIPPAKRPAFDAAMNDYRALEVNAITSSGLSASQTNTEKESQRVVGQIGSIGDKPQAAKAALEYAKAKIEYADAKARAWVEARKANPTIDRLDFETNFDATKGEQIFKDANERMAKIVGGNVGGATKEGTTSVSKSGKPIVYRNGRWEYQ